MPRFRVRDLMINVGEGSGGICEIITNCGGVTELCVENTQGCAFTENCNCTIQTCGANSCGFCTPCSGVSVVCQGCSFCSHCSSATVVCQLSRCTAHSLCGRSFVCTPTFDQTFDGGLQVEHLAALKEELKATLEKMEAHEKVVRERQMPQTVEHVDQAEKKLSEALEALKQRRAELQKRTQGGGK
jgi:hypothetical protein